MVVPSGLRVAYLYYFLGPTLGECGTVLDDSYRTTPEEIRVFTQRLVEQGQGAYAGEGYSHGLRIEPVLAWKDEPTGDWHLRRWGMGPTCRVDYCTFGKMAEVS